MEICCIVFSLTTVVQEEKVKLIKWGCPKTCDILTAKRHIVMVQSGKHDLCLLIFTGQKLFSCHMCNTSFSTKGSLKVHMRLHTGSKPFKCPFCELRFRTSGHRKTHIQCHLRPSSDRHKSKRSVSSTGQASQGQDPGAGQAVATGHGQQTATSEALQSVGLLQMPTSDPNIYLPANQVLAGQFDQNLLQPGLVGQAILPASMSGRDCGWVDICTPKDTHTEENSS